VDRLEIKSWERWALFGLLALALALRLYRLDAPLWYDEIMTVVYYVRQPVSQVVADYSMNNHIFYSLQAKLPAALFGEHPWSVRLPAALFGVASIWALWRLARPALGATEALVAAALLALSYHHIWFSQNARGYTELLFWSLAGLILFIEALGTKSWRLWGLFALVLAAGMYTHLTSASFVAALGLVYGLLLLDRWFLPNRLPQGWLAPTDRVAQFAPLGGFVLGGVITLVLLSPVMFQMAHQVAAVSTPAQAAMPEYRNPLWTVLEGIRTLGGGDELMTIAIPVAALFALIGAGEMLRRQPVIPAVALLHIAVTLGALVAISMRVWPRFFFVDVAFMLLFITHGAFVVAGWIGGLAKRMGLSAVTPARLSALFVACMVVASAGLMVRNYTTPKQDLPAAIALLQKAGAAPSSVGTLGHATEVYEVYSKPGWRPILKAADLDLLVPSHGRRWVVVIFPSRTRSEHPDVMVALNRDYEVVRWFPGTLGDGEVWVWGSKTPKG
jgi:mannosyltransferase